jgi:hypothetical protein
MDGERGGEFDSDALGDDDAAERVDVMDGDDSTDDVEDMLGDNESAVCVIKVEGVGCADIESRSSDGVSCGVDVAKLDLEEEMDTESDADADSELNVAVAALVEDCENRRDAVVSTENDESAVCVAKWERDTVILLDRDIDCMPDDDDTNDAELTPPSELLLFPETLIIAVCVVDCDELVEAYAEAVADAEKLGDPDAELESLELIERNDDSDATADADVLTVDVR